ncbi:hypothetical protein Mal64_20060 [Pseudobythopirellula maris]|uniref:Uncharacterized protein n=1 Tax=Pseudobythopirellula maris TaxID=2527991 RepID=A0A5C5ZQF8_9BACT|nr:hypothetical protein [Pseudobythopirellula maris]TWT88523.1 hypothetical protein Mal64_20060 [Pseudobythopirellula maris]
MKTNPIRLFVAAVVAALALGTASADAADKNELLQPVCWNEPACSASCDACGSDTCYAEAEEVTVEKHCWEIECEKVCVPPVRFPWQCGGSKLTLFSWLDKNKCGDCCSDGCCSEACCADACGCGAGCCEPTCGCDGCCCDMDCDCESCPPLCCNDKLSCLSPWGCKVRCVRDLKKETCEVTKCEYKWEVRRLPACCPDGCCGGSGCCGECCSTCCEP